MIDTTTLLTIVMMAVATYLTRILGYIALRNRTLSPQGVRMMGAIPGCVLISVIAPYFVSERPADLIALAITALAATRFSLLPVVVIGVASSGFLRHFL